MMKRIITAILLSLMLAGAVTAADMPKLRVGHVPEPAHGW